MSRSPIRENLRVEIYPNEPWIFNKSRKLEDALEQACNSIVQQVKRHIDDVHSVSFVYDTRYACEHCGADWTEESKDYNGGCCDEDEKNSTLGEDAA